MKNISKKKYPNCYRGYQYAKDILEEKIVSCWQIKASCERFFRDLKNEKFYLDLDSAERALRLIQKFPHIKGPLANTSMRFESWQCFIYLNVFGFKLKTNGFRRFKKVFILCSRKNGKTALSSGLGLYMLSLDGEEGSEVYSLGSKKDQARIVFDSAREQAKRSPSYLKSAGSEVFRHHIEQAKTASVYKPLASDSNSLDGLSPHCVIFDEAHSYRDRNIYGVMETATGARKQPLLWVISTAGFDDTSICHELQVDLEKVLKQEYEDDTQFGVIYTLDKEDDFRNKDCWKKSNPNLNVSLTETYIQEMVDKAIRMPGNKNNVLTKHFNIWCTASESLFDMIKFDECADEKISMEDFKNERCYVGVDLASKVDLTCFSYIFKKENNYYLFTDTFLPQGAIENSSNASYATWVHDGHITANPGEAINYDILESYFLNKNSNYNLQDAMFDPWSASQFAQNMSKKRIEMTEFKMSTANVSEPLKFLDAIIREKRLFHNGNPVQKWCFSNVVAKEDHNGNIYFRKSHDKFKIDAVVSATMAIAGWMLEENNDSVYKDRDMVII